MYAIMQGLTLMTQVFGTASQMTYHSSSHTLTFKKKKCKSKCTAADGTSIHNLQTHNYRHVTDYYLVLQMCTPRLLHKEKIFFLSQRWVLGVCQSTVKTLNKTFLLKIVGEKCWQQTTTSLSTGGGKLFTQSKRSGSSQQTAAAASRTDSNKSQH